MKDGLYHKNVWLPKITVKDVEAQLTYTYHSLEQSAVKGIKNLPQSINFSKVEFIEVEVVKGIINKVVVRMHYNTNTDIVIVVLINGLLVKTVWLNNKNDKHSTLDTRKYAKP